MTVIERIEQTVYSQKFEGAAAGLLNANIIARDLGLADRREDKIDVTSGGESITMADVYEAKKARLERDEDEGA